MQSLGSAEPGFVKIFEVAERWVVVNVWVRVSTCGMKGHPKVRKVPI